MFASSIALVSFSQVSGTNKRFFLVCSGHLEQVLAFWFISIFGYCASTHLERFLSLLSKAVFLVSLEKCLEKIYQRYSGKTFLKEIEKLFMYHIDSFIVWDSKYHWNIFHFPFLFILLCDGLTLNEHQRLALSISLLSRTGTGNKMKKFMVHSAVTIMGKTNLRKINLLGINKRKW